MPTSENNINILSSEAAEYGDLKMWAICQVALNKVCSSANKIIKESNIIISQQDAINFCINVIQENKNNLNYCDE